MPADSMPFRLLEQARTRPDAPAHYTRVGGDWHAKTWRQLAEETRRAARALIALGLEPGERTNILGFNTSEWIVMDVATMLAGGAAAGIYTTSSPVEVAYVVRHSEARVVLVEDADQWQKIAADRENLPDLRHVVTMPGSEPIDDEMVLTWDELLARADEVDEAVLDERFEAIDPEGVATLIYTSGTTGPPKAVMLKHSNLTSTADAMIRSIDPKPSAADVMLSYLPLSHIAEQMASLHCPLSLGYQVHFAESIEKVPDNLKEVEPTILFAVPRIWEKFHAAVQAKLAETTGFKSKVAAWAMDVGRQVAAVSNQGGEVGGMLGLKYALSRKLFFDKVKPQLGLRRVRTCISGSAPIAPEVLDFFAGLDAIIYEVYGLSESTGTTTFNLKGRTRFGSAGLPLPHADAKLASDGEILLGGGGIFAGYFKDEAATAAALDDGWLRTGDLGTIDDEGFVWITGRKKDIIITAGGKNVAPRNIEEALKGIELVEEAVVVGDRRKFLAALLVLDPAAVERFAEDMKIDAGAAPQHDALLAQVQAGIDKVNADLARVEQVRRFKILSRPLSADEGELTATMKIRRHAVHRNWADTIDALYADV